MKVSLLGKAVLGAISVISAMSAQADTLFAFNTNQVAVIDTLNLSNIKYIDIKQNLFAANERLVGIDLRPSNNKIYGLSSLNNLYTFDVKNNSVKVDFERTLASSLPQQAIGIDFNPAADFNITNLQTKPASLRVVASTGENFAVNVDTGAVVTQTSVETGFSAVSYINSVPGKSPTSTGLYYIDSSSDELKFAPSMFNNPTSVLTTRGGLGIDILSANGFDILGNTNAYGIFKLDDGSVDSQLFSINLQSGVATKLLTLNGSFNGLTGVAAVPEPESYALFMVGLGLIAGIARKKSKA